MFKFTLREAFEKVINDPIIYLSLDDRDKMRFRNYRRYLKTGSVSTDMMERIVKMHGYKEVRTSLWKNTKALPK